MLRAAILLLILLGPSRSAEAAVCCGSSHGVGQWLAPSETAALSLGLRGTHQLGSWQPRTGRVLQLSEGVSEHELRSELGAIARAGERLQLTMVIPMVGTWKTTPDASASGAGIGDISAGGRFDIHRETLQLRWMPTVYVLASALVPTGRPTRFAKDHLIADVTGFGYGELRAGIGLEKTWAPGWFATVIGSMGFRTAYFEVNGDRVHPSPRVQLLGATGPTWASVRLSATLGLLYEREDGARIDGVIADGTTRFRTAVFGTVAWDLSRDWNVLGSVQLDTPLDGAGQNEPIAVSPSARLRYIWGR